MTTPRSAAIERKTRETTIRVELALDGTGRCQVSTGVGFLDHMLELWARHGLFDLVCAAEGDLHVDAHHTTEDVGIVLGQAFGKALGDKAGITRFADARVPMEESLASVAVDISGRGLLRFDVRFPTEKIGEFDVELVREFLHAFCMNAAITVHVEGPCGDNSHHIAEAVFKGLARALRMAVEVDPRRGGQVPSTKGVL
ncbi:MAG: imidazoleglycerol-phosphate dehydratase HisB [Candidatus Brocadiaceae bacterium]|nr:imidazoleglycerol-phosphate dehydratase HisB [Candidatus Brocadiaceae bacterium]